MSTDPRFDGAGPDARYLAALNEGKLMLQQCDECAAMRFPPALVCRACGSPRLRWTASAGQGVVYATTTVRDRSGDYNVVLVELEHGARMMSRIEGIEPDAVQIGQQVCASIVPGDAPFVVFRLQEVSR